jgi:cytochrome c oxidase assembly protein subunit 15
MSLQGFTRLCVLATVLALLVVVQGMYLRLLHADPWCLLAAGCDGLVLAPQPGQDAARVSSPRAWPAAQELQLRVHPGAAALLGLLVVAIASAAWRRRQRPGQQVLLPMVVLALYVSQVTLGAGAQASRHAPLAVTAEVLAGLSTAALLWWLALRHGGLFTGYARPLLGMRGGGLGRWVVLGIVLLYGQLFLGAWVSSNDAALACADFPLCRGELLPALDLGQALRVWREPLANDAGMRLSDDARVTIHLLHRIGAVVVLCYLGGLSASLLRGAHDARLKAAGGALGLVLSAQVGAGIATELLGSPLAAVHGLGAAMLLLTLVSVYHVVRPSPSAV